MSADVPIGDPRPAGDEGVAGDTRQAGEEGPAGDPRPTGAEDATDAATGDTGGNDEDFDPSGYTVAEVNDYLADADADEVDRVLAAERDGKNRAGIVGE